MKKRLDNKYILLIVLCSILVITLIAGGSIVYAKYTQSAPAGPIEVLVEPGSKSGLEVRDYAENTEIEFDKIPAVYPFG